MKIENYICQCTERIAPLVALPASDDFVAVPARKSETVRNSAARAKPRTPLITLEAARDLFRFDRRAESKPASKRRTQHRYHRSHPRILKTEAVGAEAAAV